MDESLTHRFDGDVLRAKLYLDSQLSFDCESLLIELEQQSSPDSKSSIHYHVVGPSDAFDR